ncbi:NADH-ubiquinone oxidoreductase [Petrotoga miotherma DSM 10691]|uniref:NADH-ubiquinone oxidoreductase n=1 Tax=Petrotoga miotherma DSM 10691 TaxID=1434326 RepID=A0A2K1P6W3_9BACT|nr:proton-conducting transporter membrane subunit [Petrotoga miotherma]PNR98466.1 NADH-ubiquinone oxidoreductase [Petrotoga miotherma DSM 10691]
MINPVLLIVIPLLLAFVGVMFKNFSKSLLFFGLVLNTIFVFFVQKGSYELGGWQPPFGINLLVDNYSFFGIILINVLFLVSSLIGMKKIGKYSLPLLISLAGLNGMVLTNDLFNFYVFFEIATISAYIISTLHGKYHHTFNYLVLGSVGSSLYLLGIIIVYAVVGSLNMSDLSVHFSELSQNIQLIVSILIFSGLAVEAKLIPFNSWVRGIYSNVNTLTAPLFSAVYASTIFLVFGRFFSNLITVSGPLFNIFIAITFITFIFAETSATATKNMREILTFSSIGQAGLITGLFLIGGGYAAVLQLINNAFAKLVMFSTAANVYENNSSDSIDKAAGIFRKYPLVGFGFTVSALSLIGLPLFYGFYAKFNIINTAFNINWIIPLVILLGSLLEGVYYIRMLVKLWVPGEEHEEATEKLTTKFSMNKLFVISVVAVVVGFLFIMGGIYPELFGDFVQNVSTPLKESLSYLSVGVM